MMKMISLIGNKKNSQGFTFFEIMVAVAILTTGIVMIYKALLISVDHQDYLTHRLYAMNLLEHKISSLQREYQENKDLAVEVISEEVHRVLLNNRPMAFKFVMNFGDVKGLEDILQLDLSLSWRERNRLIHLSRSTYVYRL